MIEKHVEEIPPIQYACETVLSVNRELQQLTSLHAAEPRRNINPFSMRLQGTTKNLMALWLIYLEIISVIYALFPSLLGVIDACVMGGIAKYQEAFFTSEFLTSHSGHLDHVLQLRQCIAEQMRILEVGLTLHGKLAPVEVQPLHKRLVECLVLMKQRLKEWGFPSPDTQIRCMSTAFSSGGTLHHRRADSDAGIEYSTTKIPNSNHLLNTSLPTIPDRKPLHPQMNHQRSLPGISTSSGGPPSNRSSSSSSSLYGHLTVGEVGSEDEEDIYCRPSEIMEKLQAANNGGAQLWNTTATSTPVQASSSQGSTTPRSSNSAGRSKSPRWANEYIFFTPASMREARDSGIGTDRDSGIRDSLLNSIPPSRSSSKSLLQQMNQVALQHDASPESTRTPPRHYPPPLPPRSSKTSLEDSSFVSESNEITSTPPPIHPKRVPKKGPFTSSMIIMSPESQSSDSRHHHHRPPPAPPLPPKSANVSMSPMSPTPTSAQQLCPPPVPPHRAINNSTSFSNPLDLGSGSGSLVDEVCSLLAASGCMSNGSDNSKCPSSPPSSPPPLSEQHLFSGETV